MGARAKSARSDGGFEPMNVAEDALAVPGRGKREKKSHPFRFAFQYKNVCAIAETRGATRRRVLRRRRPGSARLAVSASRFPLRRPSSSMTAHGVGAYE